MIRPNATRPSVSRSRMWYSTYTGLAARRRRGRGGVSGGTGHLPCQSPERAAAVLEVAELVEARACRREKDGVARRRRSSRGADGALQGAAVLRGHADAAQRLSDRLGGLADQVPRGDGPRGHARGELPKVAALQRPAEDEVNAAVECGERHQYGRRVRGLRVVHPLDSAAAPGGLEPMRQRRGTTPGAGDVAGPPP